MKKQKQGKLLHVCSSPKGWHRAIEEAERQIEAAQEKIKRLRLSIETFEEMCAKGEPFPGEETGQKEAVA
jgi:predicted translin family RNA/ssDNA-binding protein